MADSPVEIFAAVKDPLQQLHIALWDAGRRTTLEVLNPGIDEQEVAAICRDYGAELPADVQSFYEWCNGTTWRSGTLVSDYWLIPLFKPLSLSDGLELRKNRVAGSGAEASQFKAWLPVMQSETGGLVLVDCNPDSPTREKVAIADSGDESPRIAFGSFRSLISFSGLALREGIVSHSDEHGLKVDFEKYAVLGRILVPGAPYWKQVSVSAAGTTDFHRQPRVWPDPLEKEPIRISAPPTISDHQPMSWLMTLFPVVGGFSILGFALISKSKLFLYISLAMLAVMVFFSIAMRLSQQKVSIKRDKQALERYRVHLKDRGGQLAQAAVLQDRAMRWIFPPLDILVAQVVKRSRIWERRRYDPDFLQIRVGEGNVDSLRECKLDMGFSATSEYNPEALKEATELEQQRSQLTGQPIVAELKEIGILAVIGPRSRSRTWIRAQLVQLAALRAPVDLRFYTVADSADSAEWAWAKTLPHQQVDVAVPGSKRYRTIASIVSSGDELDEILQPELDDRIDRMRRLQEMQSRSANGPALDASQLLVIVDGYDHGSTVKSSKSIHHLLERARDLGAILIVLCDNADQAPDDVHAQVVFEPDGTATYIPSGPEQAPIREIKPDTVTTGVAASVAEQLAGLRLQSTRGEQLALEEDIRLLEIFDPHDGELVAPLGKDSTNSIIRLDFKQAAEGGMGPHGILVGATGSGKSELLRSIISGLTLKHSPERLSMVLIDFKGGAAFAQISELPHVAGLITNLQDDLSKVNRMRDALLGEQERRQSILRQHGDLDDVRSYRRAQQQDPSLQPLPDLLIVVDEFAELLSSQPDFLDLFIGIGRVGRSLGMHLLLSSQRLDEGRMRGLESHLRYRVCLRTYSAEESKMVIGTPDAYLLPSIPGLGYLKVDTGEPRMFKAATMSTPIGKGSGDGHRVATELDRVVEDIRNSPAARDSRVHQVWSEPLPEFYSLAELHEYHGKLIEESKSNGRLQASFGLVDIPLRQTQEPLTLDFSGAGGHFAVVGAPQRGSSTALLALALSLANDYTPDEVRFYGADLGGGKLSQLQDLPHFGGVALRTDRQAVTRLFQQLEAEVDHRENYLAQFGYASIEQFRRDRAAGDLPSELQASQLADVFLLVDGYATLRADFEDLERSLNQLITNGLGAGIHVAISANRWGEIRPAVVDNIGSRIELGLNDPIDSNLGRKLQESLPKHVAGRGLTADGLQAQICWPTFEDADGLASSNLIVLTAKRMKAGWTGRAAEPIRTLPDVLTREQLGVSGSDAINLGMRERDLKPLRHSLFGVEPHLVVFGDSGAGKTSALRHLAQELAITHSPEEVRFVVLDPRRGLGELSTLPHTEAYMRAATFGEPKIQAISEVLAERGRKVTESDGEDFVLAPGEPRYVFICDDFDLMSTGSGTPIDDLRELLALGSDIGMHIVIARRVTGSARSLFEPTFARLRELGSPVVLLDGDPAEGLNVSGVNARRLPPGRAQFIDRGSGATLIQLPFVERLADDGARFGGQVTQ